MLLNLKDVESHVFSGGEVHVKLDPKYDEILVPFTILARIDSSDDVMKLLLVTDAIRRAGCPRLSLAMPYLPYARQDRVCNQGEAHSLKVFCKLINAQNYYEVGILDCHSDVGTALLDNCTHETNHKFIKKVILHMQTKYNRNLSQRELTIISPDAGSNKKIKDLMKELGPHVDMVKCDKTRDTKTGQLTGFEVYADDLKGKHCLIVDDICDGGGTFVGLAEELKKKNAGPLFLAVSHGIFSKGFKTLGTHFEHIYTTKSFPGQREKNLTVEL